MKNFFFFSILCFAFTLTHAQTVSLNKSELVKLKKLVVKDAEVKKQWQNILRDADAALNVSPNPADTILSEGILQGDPRKTKTWVSLNDMQSVYALAFAYKIKGDQKYLDKATAFLLAWATKNQPQGNPINDTNLDRIIFAYDLLKGELTRSSNQIITAWLTNVALKEIKTFEASIAKSKSGVGQVNNWHSHRIKEVAEVAWAVDHDSLKLWAIEAYKKQIAQNLKPDGSSLDFQDRDALHYHIYDVDPLMVTATILNRSKRFEGDAYRYQSADGSSLKAAIDWLVPYFTGEKSHAEFVNSKTPFDKKRAANGEKGYIAGTPFNPNEARSSIALADYFDGTMLKIYQKQVKSETKYPTWQFVLNEVKR